MRTAGGRATLRGASAGNAGAKTLARFKVNGRVHEVLIDRHSTLLEILREGLGLTGTKHGCELGECGACTVLVDGKPVMSCITLGMEVAHGERREIVTVEGLAAEGRLSPLQEALVETGAIQCGYCTPGMLMSATALLNERRSPTDEEIREALSGNICRCSGYSKIVEAVRLVSERSLEGREPSQGSPGRRGGPSLAPGSA